MTHDQVIKFLETYFECLGAVYVVFFLTTIGCRRITKWERKRRTGHGSGCC